MGLETYHFCYFFKKTEPYSLLIKVLRTPSVAFAAANAHTEQALRCSSRSKARSRATCRSGPSQTRKTRPEE